jgi:biotin carboxyl carrier protein
VRLDRDAVRRVIGLLKQSSAEELAIQHGDTFVRARRQATPAPGTASPLQPDATPWGPGADPAAAPAHSHLHTVRAGVVGLFHRGKGPDSEPLVEVGDRVTSGQVIAAIEALRRLTDVVCDVDGELVEVLPEDGQPVEYGQALFSIRVQEGES